MNCDTILPHYRVSKFDRDNFITNLLTILDAWPYALSVYGHSIEPPPPIPLSPSASGRPPVVTLAQIKQHCHIEVDRTDEDDELLLLEMAARIHTEQVLRRPGGLDDTAPENVKLALLVLIAHWYRNREATVTGTISGPYAFAYDALLSTETDYSPHY